VVRKLIDELLRTIENTILLIEYELEWRREGVEKVTINKA